MVRNGRETANDLWIRSWTKSFTWRILGIAILILISYFVTGNLVAASLITLIFHGIRVVLYVLHERIWELTTWGRVGVANPGINRFWFYFWLIILILAFVAIGIIGTL